MDELIDENKMDDEKIKENCDQKFNTKNCGDGIGLIIKNMNVIKDTLLKVYNEIIVKNEEDKKKNMAMKYYNHFFQIFIQV